MNSRYLKMSADKFLFPCWNLVIISILFIISQLSVKAQMVLSLEESLAIALKESYSTKSALLQLESSQKSLDAIRLGLKTGVSVEFDLPRYSRSLKSQFNPSTGSEQFFDIGYTTLEGRFVLSQPIIFSDGVFSLLGSVFGRNQFGESFSGTAQDYYSNLSFRLTQPLFKFNNLSAQLDRAEINLSKSKRNYTKSEQNLIYNVTSGFYQLLQSKKQLEISQEKVRQIDISYQTAKKKLNAGLIAEVEALQLEVDLASSKNDLLSSEATYNDSKDNFKLLIGVSINNEITVVGSLEYTPVVIKREEAISSALKNRAEIGNAVSDIQLNTLSVSEISSRGNITGNISANYGINKNNEVFGNIFKDFAEDRSVILTLTVPVWDWGKNSRETEAAKANLFMAELDLKNQKEQIEREIISLLNRLETAKARIEVLAKSVELAQKSYDISVTRFNSGIVTSFDLSQIQLRLTDAKLNSLKAIIDYKTTLADLNRKIGGTISLN